MQLNYFFFFFCQGEVQEIEIKAEITANPMTAPVQLGTLQNQLDNREAGQTEVQEGWFL